MFNQHKDLDFASLQEVKAISFSLEINLNFVWRDALRFCTKNEKGKGEASIVMNPKWINYILFSGISPCNRVVCVTFRDGDSTFGLCTVYAPNDYRNRSDL